MALNNMPGNQKKEPWRRLFPFTSRWFERSSSQMHYVDEGVGAPIVMVHGNPSWSFYYRRLIDAFRDTHRCIAMDHIGCGLSSRPSADEYDYTLQSRIDDVEALLDHLDITKNVTLVVHDWGGMIGMGVAIRRPERIKRIVVLNTAAFLLPQSRESNAPSVNETKSPLAEKPFPWQLEIARRDTLITQLLVRGLNLFCWGAAVGGSMRGLDKEVRRGMLAPYSTYRDRLAVHEFVKDIPLKPGDRSYDAAREIDDGLSRLADKHMLVCWGMQDFVFDGDFLEEWKLRFPDAQVHAFEDAGHYVLEDAPERIIPLMKSFLNLA